MPSISNLVARGESAVLAAREFDPASQVAVMDLMIVFLGIAFLGLLAICMLVLLRRIRRQRRTRQQEQDGLPQYEDIQHHHSTTTIQNSGNTKRLTITTSDGRSGVVVLDGRPMLADPNSPPHSPTNIPEIHITFPDETDPDGKQKSGRVMVVRVGDTTVGLEPIQDEQLPAYEKENNYGFYSIDMDQIGGLKEKDYC